MSDNVSDVCIPCSSFFYSIIRSRPRREDGYAECRSPAQFGMPNGELSAMVLFDDAAGKRESQAPAPLLGRESRLENLREMRGGNALAAVCDGDVDMIC